MRRPASTQDPDATPSAVPRVLVRDGHSPRGSSPEKRGRPSQHPLVAFIRETGYCLGVRRQGSGAHTAEGAQEWIGELVEWLRGAGVGRHRCCSRQGFFSRDMVRTLERLGVSFLLKVPLHGWLSRHRGLWRSSARGEAVFPGEDLRTATGAHWDVPVADAPNDPAH